LKSWNSRNLVGQSGDGIHGIELRKKVMKERRSRVKNKFDAENPFKEFCKNKSPQV
jgi:hypothetical protein